MQEISVAVVGIINKIKGFCREWHMLGQLDCSLCRINVKRFQKDNFLWRFVFGQLVIIGPGAPTYKFEIKGEFQKIK